MKCVSRGSEVRRVSDEQAERLVFQGWFYANKIIWKNSPNTTHKPNSTPPNPRKKKNWKDDPMNYEPKSNSRRTRERNGKTGGNR